MDSRDKEEQSIHNPQFLAITLAPKEGRRLLFATERDSVSHESMKSSSQSLTSNREYHP